MAETIEVICDVTYNYSQLLAGQTLISLAANESVVLRDVCFVNSKRRALSVRLNGASWLPLSDVSYSFRVTGTELLPANSALTLQTNSVPVFSGLYSGNTSSNPYVFQTTFPTVFSEELTGASNLKDLASYTSLIGSTPTGLTGGNIGLLTMFFDNLGNFYYLQGFAAIAGGATLYRRAGGVSGAQTTIFTAGTLNWAAFDKESGVVYATTGVGTIKRYDTVAATTLSDVAVSTYHNFIGSHAFTVRAGLMAVGDPGYSKIDFFNATTGAKLGQTQYSQSTGDAVPNYRWSSVIVKGTDNVYRLAYFNYDATVANQDFLTIVSLGTAPLTTWAPSIQRDLQNAFGSVARTNARSLFEPPYSNSLTQDTVMVVTPSSPANVRFVSLSDFTQKININNVTVSGTTYVHLPISDNARAAADYGTIQMRAVGVRIK